MAESAEPWLCGFCRAGFASKGEVIAHIQCHHRLSQDVRLVHVESTTWSQTKHNLFDREATEQHARSSMVLPVESNSRRPLVFYRDEQGSVNATGSGIPRCPGQAVEPMHTQLVWQQGDSEGYFAVEQTPTSSRRGPEKAKSDHMWKTVGAEGHRLQVEDRFKIGRNKLTVKEIVLEGEPRVPNYSSADEPGTVHVRRAVADGSAPALCRICMGGADSPMAKRESFCLTDQSRAEARATTEESAEELTPMSSNANEPSVEGDSLNMATFQSARSQMSPACNLLEVDEEVEEHDPLICAPCLCKGATQLVHLSCLQTWLNVRYSVSITPSPPEQGVYFSFKPPGCEICLTEFPVKVQEEDLRPESPSRFRSSKQMTKLVYLLPSLPEVRPPFIVLHIPKVNREDRERPHGERFIFAPGQATDPHADLKIGRSSVAQLRMADVSISRVHAMIAFEDGAFVLRDNGAKFQTLIFPKGPEALQAESKEPLSVQAGRTVLSFALMGSINEELGNGNVNSS